MTSTADLTPTDSSRVKLAIVGAGVTGLVCAKCLVEQHGWSCDDILLLEARPRVGGRVLTTKRGSISYDEGAAWIHGTENNPMLDLLEGRSDEIVPIADGNPWTRPRSMLHRQGKIMISVNGREMDPEVVDKALDIHFDTLKKVSDVGNRLYDEGDGLLTTQMSLDDALKRISLSDQHSPNSSDLATRIAPLFLHFLECWNGANRKDLQLSEFVGETQDEPLKDDDYAPEGDFPGPHCIIQNGMGTILEPLLRNNATIRLRHEVVRVSKEDNNDIIVSCKAGPTIVTEKCVITIPAGCLPQVVDDMFGQGSLCSDKREAIDRLEAGSYKKVFLTFSEIRWPPEPPFLGLVWENESSPLGAFMIADNLWASKQIPALEVILFGSSAEWAYQKPTNVIQDEAVEFLEHALGYSLGQVESCHVTRWEEDPFSRGAYSHMPLSGLERHREELRRPEWNDSLFFAGEATISEFEGSVHAAILSGRDTARKVANTVKPGS